MVYWFLTITGLGLEGRAGVSSVRNIAVPGVPQCHRRARVMMQSRHTLWTYWPPG